MDKCDTKSGSKFPGINNVTDLLLDEENRILKRTKEARCNAMDNDSQNCQEQYRTRAVIYMALPLTLETFEDEGNEVPKGLKVEAEGISMVAQEALEMNNYMYLVNLFSRRDSLHAASSKLVELAMQYEPND